MKGFSLPVVLFVVSLGGALAVGGAFVTRQMASAARTTTRAAELDGVAEGLATAAAAAALAWRTIPVGATQALPAPKQGEIRGAAWVTRADSLVYVVVVEVSMEHKPLIRRRLGITLLVDSVLARPAAERAWTDLP